MAYRLTGNTPDSEDLLQDVVEKCFRQPERLQQLDYPLSWLKRILYNQFVDSYRRKKLQPLPFAEVESGTNGDFVELQVSPDRGPEAIASRLQNQITLQQALDSLPDNQRELVVLHDVEGMTLIEVADMLEEPLGTLKSRLHRARKSLREKLCDATF